MTAANKAVLQVAAIKATSNILSLQIGQSAIATNDGTMGYSLYIEQQIAYLRLQCSYMETDSNL